MYASGLSVAQLEQVVADIDWQDAFSDKPPRNELAYRRKRDDNGVLIKFGVGIKETKLVFPKGLVQGQKLQLILQSLTLPVIDQSDFSQLPIPYRAVATNIVTAESVILEHGNLARAMRASMSVPGIFAPVEIDGQLLVDGGLVDNLPVNLAKEMGADIVIAVDIATPLSKRDELDSAIGITDQVTNMMTQINAQQQKRLLTDNDILITPDLHGISSADFFLLKRIIGQGESAALERLDRIKKLSLSESVFHAYQELKQSKRQDNPSIDEIRIVNDSPLADEIIRERIDINVGEPIDLALLQRSISRIYGLATFDEVSFDIANQNGVRELIVNVRERDIGNHNLRFGLNLENDFKGGTYYGLTARSTSLMLNPLGGEWQNNLQIGDTNKISTDYLQPLDYKQHYFVDAYLEYSDSTDEFMVDEARNQGRIKQWTARAFVGRQLYNWGAIVAGVSRGVGDRRVRIGGNTDLTEKFNAGAYLLQAGYDTLDSVSFPHAGAVANAALELSRTSVGADAEYDSLTMFWAGALTREKNTLLVELQGGTVFSDENTPSDQFTLGGFFKLSGYGRNELSGRYYLLQNSIFYHRLSETALLSYPLYIGGSLEFGNTWEDKTSLKDRKLLFASSLFLGIDSFFGSMYLAIGHAEGNKTSLYMFLGQAF